MLDPHLIFENTEDYLDFITSENSEGQYFDRKEVRNDTKKDLDDARDKVVKTISAFTNARGGILVLGVADNGEVKGINHLSETERISLCKIIDDKLTNHHARSREYSIGDKIVLLIYAPEGSSGICETTETPPKSWKRESANSLPLTSNDRERLVLERGRKFEQLTVCEYDFALVNKTIYELFKKMYIEHTDANFQDDDATFLQNIGACKRENGILKFTNAGYLFFASNPRSYIPSAYVRFLKYENEFRDNANAGNATFDRDFDGSLPEVLRKVRSFITETPYFKRYSFRNPNTSGIIEETEYPLNAVEEAVVNAIIHRDYNSNQPITCYAYRDSFLVRSYGSFKQDSFIPTEFNLGEVNLLPYRRNPLLVEWARLMKDENGQRFVKSLREGTQTMLDSMRAMQLSAPHYRTNGSTDVLFYNNYVEREAKYYSFNKQLENEFTNLYKVTVFSNNNTNYDLNEVRRQTISLFKDKLKNSNWFIDSEFGLRIVAHPKGKHLELHNKASEYLQIFPAYTFQVYWIGSDLYLSIDYDVQVKNRASIANLIQFSSIDFRHKKAFVKYGNAWTFAVIQDTTDYYARVFLPEFEKETDISTKDIIPNLKVTEIKSILLKQNISFDLDKKIKEFSLASEVNAAKIRSQKINEITKFIARDIFPIAYNGYVTQLTEKPIQLIEADLQISEKIVQSFALYTLPEPKVKFNDNSTEEKIANGLSKYGAFEFKPKQLEIIPFCINGYTNKMENLLKVLQTGSNTFKGLGKTFATNLKYTGIITKPNAEDFLAECERLLSQNPTWEGNANLDRLFLIHVPESKYDVNDINSPYYVLKEFLLEKGIPVQMIDSNTLEKTEYKDLNLALNIVAKTGGVPWVLPDKLPDADIFIGLSYTQYKSEETLYRTMGYANVFSSYGQWKYYKGNANAFNFDEKGKYFSQLVENTLIALNNELSESPSIHIHYSDRFSKEDRIQISEAVKKVKPKAKITFIWLNLGHNIRMFDNRIEGNGSLARGSYITISPNQFYLSTTGYNTLRKTLGTPIMLEVNVQTDPNHAGDIIPFQTIAQHLLSLTKLNWASSQSINGEPVTIKYARSIARLSSVFLRRRGVFHLHKVLEQTPWFI